MILVADELSASVAAQVDWEEVVGFVSDAGSWTYHTAILARSLRVPAVVGLRGASALVPPGSRLAMDGGSGEVRIDPSDDELAAFAAAGRSTHVSAPAVDEFRRLPAVTPDGVSVTLEANIELAEDVADARANGAQGVGLCRSEFLLGAAAGSAGEPTQFDAYRRILEAMAPSPVTIRTFDGVEDDREPRGRAGLRGLRLSLARREPFRIQIRALLRAAHYGRLRILLPFVTDLDELREARRIVAEVAADLASRGESAPTVPVGAMIEVPAAAVAADLLASEADFLAVGTNDLVQFALAVDRADERVSDLVRSAAPGNPAPGAGCGSRCAQAGASAVSLRRDGRRSRARGSAGGSRRDRVEHADRRHPAGDAGASRDAGGETPGGSLRARSAPPPRKTSNAGWRRS